MIVEYSTFCEAGTRPYNEDYIRVVELPDQHRTLFVLCDGMGDHAMGDIASSTVGDVFANYWQKKPEFKDCEKKIREVCHKATVAIDRKSFDMGHMQMGTTMVMASIENTKITIAHVGDSRCYLLRKGYSDWEKFADSSDINHVDSDIVYQTQDHVNLQFGWETVAKCFFSYRPEVAVPDIREFELQQGDAIFLCSDGVNKYVRPNIMKERLMDNRSPEQIADVIKFLCEKGSQDNYSGIVVKIK